MAEYRVTCNSDSYGYSQEDYHALAKAQAQVERWVRAAKRNKVKVTVTFEQTA